MADREPINPLKLADLAQEVRDANAAYARSRDAWSEAIRLADLRVEEANQAEKEAKSRRDKARDALWAHVDGRPVPTEANHG